MLESARSSHLWLSIHSGSHRPTRLRLSKRIGELNKERHVGCWIWTWLVGVEDEGARCGIGWLCGFTRQMSALRWPQFSPTLLGDPNFCLLHLHAPYQWPSILANLLGDLYFRSLKSASTLSVAFDSRTTSLITLILTYLLSDLDIPLLESDHCLGWPLFWSRCWLYTACLPIC
jgi:hypothetical protein